MSDDSILERELAALTRRMDEMEQRLAGLIQTNGIQLAMTLGERLASQEGRINSKIDELREHIDRRNTEVIDQITRHIGQPPE